ncbi:MAG TPA: GNAT family N-acetyltransferase [Thermoanaerobaculia bacterium]|jgi:ribosomal protein S18 acetylase RimI-like enzyme
MPLVVRKAEPRDLDALGRLGAMLMQTHYAFDSLRFIAPHPGVEQGYAAFLGSRIDSPDECVFVAEVDGRVAGYLFAALEPLSWKELRGPAGYIHDVAVEEPDRHKGIATMLMEAGFHWLREHGAPRVVLGTAARNARAQELFHRLGFRDTMIEMTKEL